MNNKCESCMHGEQITPSHYIFCELYQKLKEPEEGCEEWIGSDEYGRIFRLKEKGK